jgi:hypothetical protein
MGECRYSSILLDLVNGWRWVVSSTPWPLYLRERTPRTHWLGGYVGPRAGLDAMEWKKKTFVPAVNRTPAVQPVPRRYTD